MIDLKPWGELNTSKIGEAKVCIMGIPFDGAVSCGKGAALAPESGQILAVSGRRPFRDEPSA